MINGFEPNYIENRVVVQFASYVLITYGNVINDLAFVSIVNFVTIKEEVKTRKMK